MMIMIDRGTGKRPQGWTRMIPWESHYSFMLHDGGGISMWLECICGIGEEIIYQRNFYRDKILN